MLALLQYDALCCSGCGGYLLDTTDRDAEETYRAEAARCHRCTAIAQEAEGYKDSRHSQALQYRVGRR